MPRVRRCRSPARSARRTKSISPSVSRADARTQGQRRRQGHAGPGRRAARSAERAERLALGAGEFSAAQGQLDPGAQQLSSASRTLLAQGWTTRAQFDQAQQALQTAQAQVDSAQAQLKSAQDRSATPNSTPTPAGSVTAIGAEPGEVVRAGQMIVQVAREGGRDAVFDVPAQAFRTRAARSARHDRARLTIPRSAPWGACARSRPQADPVTRTFQVKVGLIDPPRGDAARRDGDRTVRRRPRAEAIEIPASALTESDGKPAVWVVDPAAQTVSLRAIEVARYDPASVVVAGGLQPARSSSPPACRRCGRARRSACSGGRHERSQPFANGRSSTARWSSIS